METQEAKKTISQDAEKILKLQDKLSSIQNQIHFWSAKSKGNSYLKRSYAHQSPTHSKTFCSF